MPRHLILSRAHEWSQALPLSSGLMACSRCKVRLPMADIHLHAETCKPHFEHPDSGWLGEVIQLHA